MAANDIHIPDVKNIISHLNSLKDIKSKDVIKNVHTFESISPYIIEFYNISNKMFLSISQLSEGIDKKIMDSQKILIESIGKTIDTVNKLNDIKFDTGINFEIKLLFLKRKIRKITELFIGPGSIVSCLNQFNNLKSGGSTEIYNDEGKLIRKTTINGFNPSDVIKGFNQLVTTIIDIVDKSKELSKNIIISYNLLNYAWPKLIADETQSPSNEKNGGIIDRYVDLLGSKSIQILQNEKIQDQIELVGDNIQNINSIIESIASIEKYKIHPKKIHRLLSKIESVINDISDLSQQIKSKKFAGIKPQINTIKSIIDSMLGLVGDIVLLGLSLIPLSLAFIPAIGAIFLIWGFIKVAKFVINRISDEKDYGATQKSMGDIVKIIGAMLLMMSMVLAELILISLSLPILTKSAGATIAALAIIGVVTLAIAWLSKIIGRVLDGMKSAWSGIMFMVGLIGTMMIITGMLILFAYLATDFFADGKWLNSLKMFGVISVVTLAIAGIGYLIMLMLPGITSFAIASVSLLVSIGAMLLVGSMLISLAEFEFTKEQQESVREKSTLIINTAHDIMNAMFRGSTTDENGKTTTNESTDNGFKRFFKGLFKGSAMMVEALASSVVLIMTFVSVVMISVIGNMLVSISKIDINKDDVISKVNTIMGTANSVIDAVFEPAEEKKTPGGSGFLGVLKHIFTGLVDIMEIVVSIGKMALIMISIGMIHLIGGELKWISKFDINSINNATTNVNTIMSVADAVIDAIFNPTINQPNGGNGGSGSGSKFLGFIKNTLKGIGSVVESVVGIGKVGITLAAVGMVAFLAKTLKTINDISNEINKEQILNNTNLILSVSDQIVKKVFDTTTGFDIDKKKIKSFNTLTDSLDKFIKVSNNKAENLENNINNTIRFVDKIDSIKLENLEAATNMFAKMAEFSESINGNFEGLADTINEKLMPLLEELNTSLGNTSSSINNISGGVSGATTNTTAVGVDSRTGKPVNTQDYSKIIQSLNDQLVRIQDILTNGEQQTALLT